MKFADGVGPKSRYWWLRLIKQHGEEGVGAIGEAASVSSPTARGALDELVAGGYVSQTGGYGTGVRPKFYLSSFGHRHINEQQVPEDAVRTGTVHTVEHIPDAPMFEIPRAEPELATVPEPEEQPDIAPEPVQPTQPSRSTHQGSPDVGAFRQVLSEILVERFADQVTAKDVLERLEAER
jgi:hypothetical protein